MATKRSLYNNSFLKGMKSPFLIEEDENILPKGYEYYTQEGPLAIKQPSDMKMKSDGLVIDITDKFIDGTTIENSAQKGNIYNPGTISLGTPTYRNDKIDMTGKGGGYMPKFKTDNTMRSAEVDNGDGSIPFVVEDLGVVGPYSTKNPNDNIEEESKGGTRNIRKLNNVMNTLSGTGAVLSNLYGMSMLAKERPRLAKMPEKQANISPDLIEDRGVFINAANQAEIDKQGATARSVATQYGKPELIPSILSKGNEAELQSSSQIAQYRDIVDMANVGEVNKFKRVNLGKNVNYGQLLERNQEFNAGTENAFREKIRKQMGLYSQGIAQNIKDMTGSYMKNEQLEAEIESGAEDIKSQISFYEDIVSDPNSNAIQRFDANKKLDELRSQYQTIQSNRFGSKGSIFTTRYKK